MYLYFRLRVAIYIPVKGELFMQEGLRDYLRNLYHKNKLEEIEDISIEDIPNLIFANRKSPQTIWIKKVRGFESGFLFNVLSSRDHYAIVFGCTIHEIWPAYLKCLSNPVKPVLIKSGSVQEVQYIGSQVDLYKLPVVKYNALDASPYITAGVVLARDPETGIRNVSIHRLQVQGKQQLGIRLEPGSHLELIRKKAGELGKRVEVAITIGNHPAEIIAAVSKVHFGLDELEIAGAIRGEHLQLTKCVTIDAEVPAWAEIVLEGYIDPEDDAPEGPFGDFMGYYVPRGENPTIHLTAITHRENPVFQGIRAGSLEDSLLLALSREAAVFKAIKEAGIDVVGVNLSPVVFNGVISLRPKDKAEVRRALEIALEQAPWLKYCVAVDPDVDIFNWEDVLWALATRSSPDKAIVFNNTNGFSRDPFNLHRSKLIIDATIPGGAGNAFRRAIPR
ncbi:decarboxylase [Moorella sp. E306M]|nr:decarboxylase [Moorella sp. E306M]